MIGSDLEALLVILAILYFVGLPIAVIFLLMRTSGLRNRLERLEIGQSLDSATAPAQPLRTRTPDPVARAEEAPCATEPAVTEPAATEPAVTEPPTVSEPPAAAPEGPSRPPVWAKPAAARAERPAPKLRQGAADAWITRAATWIAAHWFYVISAISLALAGLFMVQYGVQNGLLPPPVRVLAAIVFGLSLIVGGEVIRRRFGDHEGASTAFLPSVFSGAGIVTLFGAVLSARLLYDLIGPEVALVAMCGVALGAMVLGWLHGPLLAAVGVIGAFVAPMIVGGASEDSSWLYIYFAVITFLGLGIDTLRRWAWVSVVTLALGIGVGWLVMLGGQSSVAGFGLYMTVLAFLALLIPARALAPNHEGAMLTTALRGMAMPGFPTVLAAGGLAAASAALALVAREGAAEFWLALMLLTLLGLAWSLWSGKATALQDQALMPLAALFAAVAYEGQRLPVFVETAPDPNVVLVEPAFPLDITALVGIGALWSLAAAIRSWRGGEFAWIWAAAAAVIAPALAIVIEVLWVQTERIGAYPWALHAAALAAGMVLLAERFARKDGPEARLRVSMFALSALSCLTFAVVIVLSSAALTLALAVAVLAAVLLDRRFDLSLMTVFVGAGILSLSYRLVIDPGVDWAVNAPFWQMVLAYGGTLAAVIVAWSASKTRSRRIPVAILESASWTFGGIFACLLIFRAIAEAVGQRDTSSDWALGIFASVWALMMLAQLALAYGEGGMRRVRLAMAAVFGVLFAMAMAPGVFVASPVIGLVPSLVRGPVLVNTLAAATLLPAAILWLGLWRITVLPRAVRLTLGAIATALTALWLFSVIRHFWQGPERMPIFNGVTDLELSTYTVVVLIVGAGLFLASLARGSTVLRRAGLLVIGLAVAKVFLVDMGSLGGLTRVFSFLLLGMALAGLAWLNTWAQKSVEPRG